MLKALTLILVPFLLIGCGGAATTETNIYYVHTDHLSTPKVITNKDQKPVWKVESNPFGVDISNAFTSEFVLTGTVYADFRSTDPVSQDLYLSTTPQQDVIALQLLGGLEGHTGPYRLSYPQCHSFSQDMFDFFNGYFFLGGG